jgi:hypothetical protein
MMEAKRSKAFVHVLRIAAGFITAFVIYLIVRGVG